MKYNIDVSFIILSSLLFFALVFAFIYAGIEFILFYLITISSVAFLAFFACVIEDIILWFIKKIKK
jgi:hypothetical protein